MSKYIKKTLCKQYTTALNIQDILIMIAHKTNYQPKLYGKGYRARCPAHEDRNPSLSISEGDDERILMHCFGPCTVDDICSSIGIKVRDLFPQKNRW